MGGACVDDTKEVWIVPERNFGETCISHRECLDGVCLPLGPDNGGVCSKDCQSSENCPEGWSCREWTASGYFTEEKHVCVQDTQSRLCLSCIVDGQCNATGDLCIEIEDGRVCAQDCSTDACPTGYECAILERDGRSHAQCVPIDNTCECGPGKEGMGRACNNSNEFGVCAGWTYCKNINGEYAWSDCDAQIPAEEVCNGIDDDCDGLIDSFDPSLSHAELGETGNLYPVCYLGGCIGRWQCRTHDNANYAWECDASDPENEICNGADDNCNGIVDEPFINDDGLYVDVNNCGACGASCLNMLSDLRKDAEGKPLKDAAKCEVRDGTSTCVPLLCAEGYYPYPHENPISCIKLESPACQVCGNDNDCHVYSDRCKELSGDFGTHCLQSCDENSPYTGCSGKVGVQSCCPTGYQCQVMDGEKLCIPKGESCSCDQSKLNMTRNCAVSSGTDICQGRQTCQKLDDDVFAWSECSADTLTVEVCDGQDNNCNGEIDEDFRDSKGRYNAEEHCGKCNEDCPSHWKAPELHASGACLLDGEDYSCQFTGCKIEDESLGKRCGSDQDCPNNMKCDRQGYFCRAENSDDTAIKCTQDSDCKSVTSSHKCIGGKCLVKVQYHDVNGIAADGCECGVAVNNGTDDPEIFAFWPKEDSAYIDRNCDGIDGDAATSLFVSAQTTASKGTMEYPYQTIAEAINAFDPTKHTAILVAAGTYIEQVVMKSGVRLFGGYSADFKTRNIILNPTLISPPPPADDSRPGSVYFPSVKRKTVLNGFVINGYDASDTNASSAEYARNTYAIYISEAVNNITITNNSIIAGHAGDGKRGTSGASGEAGQDGSDGLDSRECDNATCTGLYSNGGKAGTNASCKSANGRTGATARGGSVPQDFIMSDERDGQGGANNSYSQSYSDQRPYCKYDCLSGGYANGSDGKNGTNGYNGHGGDGCAAPMGTINNQTWHGHPGQKGTGGGAATGGGGGGAGGRSINDNVGSGCTDGRPVGDIGGSGGGGAAGGCGGQAGLGGQAGGGAFGIWIAALSSDPNIQANQTRLGIGGKGGDGGDGGAGGKGGKGGVGGHNQSPAWCAGTGGSGGGGGDGGSAGGGGGGCGGDSIGIAGNNIPGKLEKDNDFE